AFVAGLVVVLLVVDAVALLVLAALHLLLFLRADMAITAGDVFLVVDLGLAALELGRLMLGQRAVLHARLDALLLVDVALHVGLHALRRGRQRVAVHAVAGRGVDVAARLVLGGLQLGALVRAQLAVLHRLGLQAIDLGFVALQQRAFTRRDAAVLQALLDALLLLDVALHGGGGGLRESAQRRADQQGRDDEVAFHDGGCS